MNDEILFDGVRYVSAADASREAGFTQDHIARLGREGKIVGRQMGKNWFVNVPSLQAFIFSQSNSPTPPSDEVVLNKVPHITAADASRETNLTRDHVARLCREGKIRGKRVGKNWYIERQSLWAFVLEQAYTLEKQRDELARQRTVEYHARVPDAGSSEPVGGGTTSTVTEVNASSFPSQRVSPSGIANSENIITDFIGTVLRVAQISPSAVMRSLRVANKLISVVLILTTAFGVYAFVDPSSARNTISSIFSPPQNQNRVTSTLVPVTSSTNTDVAAVVNYISFRSGSAKILRSLQSGIKSFSDAVLSPFHFPAESDQFLERGTIIARVVPVDTSEKSASQASSQTITNNTYNTYNTTNNTGGSTYNSYTAAGAGGVGGVSETEFQTKIKAITDSIRFQSYPSSVPSSGGMANNIAIMQNINNLTGTRLNNVTVNGVSGLTATDIPTLQYLALSGGTLTGALNSTYTDVSTLSGSLSMGGNVAIGSTTSTAKLAVGAKESDTSPVLFEISSSTNSLFSVDNTGLTTFVNATGVAATTTTFFSTTSSSTNTYSTNASFGLANIATLTAGSTTLANLLAGSANITGDVGIGGALTLTGSTNIFSTNASTTNATSTNLFSVFGHFTTGVVDTLTSTLSTITNLFASNATFTNATTTNGSITSLITTGATSTNFYTSLLGAVTASTTNLTFQTAVGGNATTTNFFSTIASSTNLFSTNANLGVLTAGTLSLTSGTTT